MELPPLNLNTTATSGAKGGFFQGGGNNALREGDWLGSTGSATGSTVPALSLASGKSFTPFLVIAVIAAVAWHFKKKL